MGLLGNCIRQATFGAAKPLYTRESLLPTATNRYDVICYQRSQDKATTILVTTANPIGCYPPKAFYPPQEVGAMSMRSFSSGNLSGSLISDKTMELDMTGFGDFQAFLSSVVSMLLSMGGTGTLEADIAGVVSMELDMGGVGTLEAELNGIANLMLNMFGSGDLSSDMAADGFMTLNITVTGTGLSTANVGKYVWEALVAEFATDPNSAAAKLLAVGSAGDPWSTNLPASYTGDQAGKLLSQIQELAVQLSKLQGLDASDPVTRTPDEIRTQSGDIIIEVSGDGVNDTTLTRQP